MAAYLRHCDCNVLAVEWPEALWPSYLAVTFVLPRIADFVAEAVNDVMKFGVPPGHISLCGVGIGAQLVGLVGQKTARKVARVVGKCARSAWKLSRKCIILSS